MCVVLVCVCVCVCREKKVYRTMRRVGQTNLTYDQLDLRIVCSTFSERGIENQRDKCCRRERLVSDSQLALWSPNAFRSQSFRRHWRLCQRLCLVFSYVYCIRTEKKSQAQSVRKIRIIRNFLTIPANRHRVLVWLHESASIINRTLPTAEVYNPTVLRVSTHWTEHHVEDTSRFHDDYRMRIHVVSFVVVFHMCIIL